MPENIDNNQPDSSNGDNQAGEDEHETHTTALVLLSLATLVIIVVVLSVGQSVEDINTKKYIDQPQQPRQMSDSAGPGIPVEQVETQQADGLDGFPQGFTLPDDAEIVNNYSNKLGSRTQRNVVFTTDATIADLVSQYESWGEDNGYKVESTSSDAESGSVRLSSNTGNLTFSIAEDDGSRRVQVNYITSQ